MDQNIASYRINMRNRKWYWPLIAYLLNVSMNNAWQLYRLTPQGREDGKDLLMFTRSVVLNYLNKCKIVRKKPEHTPMRGKCRVAAEVRLSTAVQHVLETSETIRRCAQCGKNARKYCTVCNVACHIHCFAAFHMCN